MADIEVRPYSDAVLIHAPQPYNSFDFTPFLLRAHQHGLPADRPICKAYASGHCPNGTKCLERHVSDPAVLKASGQSSQQHGSGLNSLVCKHWLRGLCKKGEQCEFLHEYNLRKMPECNFFARNGYCSNGEECLYLHIDPMMRLPPCAHYERGFCPLGPNCSKRHVRRTICHFYLAGFCPEGRECTVGMHPKWKKDLERPVAKGEEGEEGEERRVDTIMEEERESRGGGRDRDRDRDREDGGGRHRHGRGGKWRGRGERRYRGRGGY